MLMMVFWGICGLGCAYMAENKGRSKMTWAILGLIFGIYAVVILYLLPCSKAKEYRDNIEKFD